MDEDAKVHWAETVDKPRYRQFTISGEPWAIWLQDKKDPYEPTFYSTNYYPRTGKFGLLGKTREIWARYLL
jgi:hypothetical protein